MIPGLATKISAPAIGRRVSASTTVPVRATPPACSPPRAAGLPIVKLASWTSLPFT